MALDMTNATYARSASGAKTLKENSFATSIAAIKKAINGDKYKEVIKAVDNNWVGADADDFIRDISRTKNDIISRINTLQNTFSTAIDGEAREFASFQAKNVK